MPGPKRLFCIRCASARGKLTGLVDVAALNLTGSGDQLDKFLKHTSPAHHPGFTTILQDSSYEQYRSYIITTAASGALQEDDNGSCLVWRAAENTGFGYDGKTNTIT